MPLAYIQFIETPDRPERPSGGWGRPDHELPGPQPHPEHPIAPGGPPTKPIDPDLPVTPGHPLPPGQLPSLPTPPGDLSNKIVVLIWKPGEGWKGKVFDTSTGTPGHPLPGPQPHPEHPIAPGGPPNKPVDPNAPAPDPHGYPSEQARWNR